MTGVQTCALPICEAIANKKVTLAEGIVVDEDLWNTVTTFIPGNYVHFWVNSTNDWTWATGNSFPVPYTASGVPATQNPKYNELGVGLTEVVLNNRWFNTYILATNSLDPVFRFVVIVGQQVYTSLAAAQGESIGALNLGNSGEFPFQESVALYQITWRRGPYDLGLALNPYARIDALARIVGERITVAGIASTSHATLTNRDSANCHPATAIGYSGGQFDYGAGDEPILTCSEVDGALDQLITRFTGDTTWVAGAPDVFTNYDATCTWGNTYAEILMSVTIDVLGVILSGRELSHRKITATLTRTLGTYAVLVSDSEILYEDATFESARLAPGTYLDGAMNDYVEVFDGATFGVRCAAIDGIPKCRYSVNIVINELIVVDKAPA